MKDPALKPMHPGEILLEDFLKPLSISQYRLAKEIHVPARRVNEIALGRRGVSADTALRLGRYFNTTPQFWLNLQSHYELDQVRLASAKEIEKSIHPLPKAACSNEPPQHTLQPKRFRSRIILATSGGTIVSHALSPVRIFCKTSREKIGSAFSS